MKMNLPEPSKKAKAYDLTVKVLENARDITLYAIGIGTPIYVIGTALVKLLLSI